VSASRTVSSEMAPPFSYCVDDQQMVAVQSPRDTLVTLVRCHNFGETLHHWGGQREPGQAAEVSGLALGSSQAALVPRSAFGASKRDAIRGNTDCFPSLWNHDLACVLSTIVPAKIVRHSTSDY
jgi:hypothetical protein